MNGHFSNAAFPSGHAAQSVAFYATLAVILGAGRSARAKTVLRSMAALIALAVGASRIVSLLPQALRLITAGVNRQPPRPDLIVALAIHPCGASRRTEDREILK
jgi:hypothetical protein